MVADQDNHDVVVDLDSLEVVADQDNLEVVVDLDNLLGAVDLDSHPGVVDLGSLLVEPEMIIKIKTKQMTISGKKVPMDFSKHLPYSCSSLL